MPVASTTSAPAGISSVLRLPTATIRSSLMRTRAPGMGGPSWPSSNRPPTMARSARAGWESAAPSNVCAIAEPTEAQTIVVVIAAQIVVGSFLEDITPPSLSLVFRGGRATSAVFLICSPKGFGPIRTGLDRSTWRPVCLLLAQGTTSVAVTSSGGSTGPPWWFTSGPNTRYSVTPKVWLVYCRRRAVGTGTFSCWPWQRR